MSTSQWSTTNSLVTKASYIPTSETAILNPTPGGNFGSSIDISSDGTYAVIGATGEMKAYIFLRTGTSWSIQAKLNLGYYVRCVSIDATGTRAVIGADAGNGTAFVYSRSGVTWALEAVLSTGYAADNSYYCSISGNGLTVIVSSPSWNSYWGLCKAFTRSGTTWTGGSAFWPSDGSTNVVFGISIDINYDGTYAVFGTQRGSAGTNCAYIFTGSGVSWTQQAKILSPEGGSDYFGWVVNITNNGDRVILGAPFSSGTGKGRAYIYSRSDVTWSQESILTSNNPTNLEWFGWSVSISNDGTKATVGAYGGDPPTGTDAGKAYVFTRSGTIWSYGGFVYGSDTVANDAFGKKCSISGDGAIVISSCEAKNGNFGRAYVFS